MIEKLFPSISFDSELSVSIEWGEIGYGCFSSSPSMEWISSLLWPLRLRMHQSKESEIISTTKTPPTVPPITGPIMCVLPVEEGVDVDVDDTEAEVVVEGT